MQFDAERLLAVLTEEGVQFVLVGGYAALLHGATRPTQDVDVSPATSPDNLTRLTRALKRLGARIRTDAVPEGLPFDTSAEALRGLVVVNLITEFGDLDLTFEPTGTGGYSDLAERAVVTQIGSVRIAVAALADVIRSKEAAGRGKDAIALPELYQLLRDTNGPAG